MLVGFNEICDSSRIWIFQSDLKIENNKIELIKNNLEKFLIQWSSHGKDLQCSYEIKHNLFIIIAVDSSVNNATGCSVDSLTNFILKIQENNNINFFNRLSVAYNIDNEIKLNSLSDIKEMIKDKKFSPETIVYNNLVKTKKEYLNKWKVPALKSWHKNLFI
tara:strand:+ start:1201 stop:1686 length:486 start_codon:yes stop_codon:yes gene_type:complete